MSDANNCPACGVAYTEHLGLIGTCYRLQEAISVVDVLEKRLAEISTDWIVAQEKIRVLREALERIARRPEYKSGWTGDLARKALQRAGNV